MQAVRIGQLLSAGLCPLISLLKGWETQLLCGRHADYAGPAERFPVIKSHVAMAIAELWHVIKKEELLAPKWYHCSEITWPFCDKLISCTFLHMDSSRDS
jgi:hypothetical protein